MSWSSFAGKFSWAWDYRKHGICWVQQQWEEGRGIGGIPKLSIWADWPPFSTETSRWPNTWETDSIIILPSPSSFTRLLVPRIFQNQRCCHTLPCDVHYWHPAVWEEGGRGVGEGRWVRNNDNTTLLDGCTLPTCSRWGDVRTVGIPGWTVRGDCFSDQLWVSRWVMLAVPINI